VLSKSTRADSRIADELLEKVLRVMANPNRALERMESLANADLKKAMVASVLKAWAKQEGPDKAFEWIQTKDDYGTRNAYMKTYLRDIASVDPARGFELALTIEQPNLREESARWLLMQWRDRAKAREAYLTLLESVRTEHLTMNVAPFLGRDPEAAFDVASRLPEGFHRDQFQYAGIRNIVQDSPEQAVEAVERMTDEPTRDQALKYIGRSWLKQGVERERQWLENESGLAKKSIDKLLKGEKR